MGGWTGEMELLGAAPSVLVSRRRRAETRDAVSPRGVVKRSCGRRARIKAVRKPAKNHFGRSAAVKGENRLEF